MADNGDCKALDIADIEEESASSLGLDQAAVLELIDFLAANGYATGIAGWDDDLSFAAEWAWLGVANWTWITGVGLIADLEAVPMLIVDVDRKMWPAFSGLSLGLLRCNKDFLVEEGIVRARCEDRGPVRGDGGGSSHEHCGRHLGSC